MKGKVYFEDDDIRRLEICSKNGFKKLNKIVGSKGIDNFVVKYKDEDGDLISISVSQELEEAIEFTQAIGEKTLKLYVFAVKGDKKSIKVSSQDKGESETKSNVPDEQEEEEEEEKEDKFAKIFEKLHALHKELKNDEYLKKLWKEKILPVLKEIGQDLDIDLEKIVKDFKKNGCSSFKTGSCAGLFSALGGSNSPLSALFGGLSGSNSPLAALFGCLNQNNSSNNNNANPLEALFGCLNQNNSSSNNANPLEALLGGLSGSNSPLAALFGGLNQNSSSNNNANPLAALFGGLNQNNSSNNANPLAALFGNLNGSSQSNQNNPLAALFGGLNQNSSNSNANPLEALFGGCRATRRCDNNKKPCNKKKAEEQKQVPKNAKFVSDESIPDGTYVAPGNSYMKIWKMKNNTEQEWGSNIRLKYIGGSIKPVQDAALVSNAKPGEEVLVTMEFNTQNLKPGKHTGIFRLVDGSNSQKVFGDQIWIIVNVIE